MNMLADIFSTIIEGWGVAYLARDEQISGRRRMVFITVYTVIFQILTHLIYLDQIGLKLFLAFIIMILMGRYILQLPLIRSVFYMCIGYMVMMFEELCINQIALAAHIEFEEGYTSPTVAIIVGKTLYITLIIFVWKVIGDIGRNKLNVRSLSFFFLSNIGYSVVGICIFMNLNTFRDTVYTNIFIVCSVTMLLSLIVNILFTERYLAMERKERDQMMAIYELEVNAKYYEDKLKEEERIKSIYHDMKNHLILLEGAGSPSVNPAESIGRLRKELSKYEDYFRTGNRYLDMILRDKRERAEQEGILVEDDIDFQKGGFMEAVDISTIFGNLLDNAIEACRGIPDKKERKIYVSAKQENKMLVICVKNNKLYEKTAGNVRKAIHGYGLMNVTNAVNKYDGGININETEDSFTVHIIIPVQNRSDI